MGKDDKHIAQLDGLRAIAVLMVTLYHAWPALKIAGWHGVTIFFVLSGYLITSITLREEKDRGWVSLAAFYIRRTFRIFPLYYLILGLYCVLMLAVGLQPQKRQGLLDTWPYFVAYLQEFAFAFHGGFDKLPFGQSWSLGIEEKFYLCWPVLVFFFLGRKPQFRTAIATGLVLVSAGLGAINETCRLLISHYAYILMGCLLALRHGGLRQTAVSGKYTYPALAAAAVLQLGFSTRVQASWAIALTDTAYGMAVVIFLRGILSEHTLLRSALAWSPIAYVGRISYGIYLVHTLCLNSFKRIFTEPSALFLFTCVGSVLFASLLYHFIEKPLIAVGRELSSRVQARNRGTIDSAPLFQVPRTDGRASNQA